MIRLVICVGLLGGCSSAASVENGNQAHAALDLTDEQIDRMADGIRADTETRKVHQRAAPSRPPADYSNLLEAMREHSASAERQDLERRVDELESARH